MKVAGVVTFLIVGAAMLLLPSHTSAAEGTGEVARSRLPWKVDTSRLLTQGWFGCNDSHCISNGLQYAVDFGGIFPVLMATEGDAVCVTLSGGWGNTILVTRPDGNIDRYAHLLACPFATKHVEQGDDVGAISDETGCPGCGEHLHFQVQNGSGQTQAFSLSGIGNFCDHIDNINCFERHVSESYESDNAGPGMNDGTELNHVEAQAAISEAYQRYGHYLCPGPPKSAWDCFGSSIKFVDEPAGPLAARSMLGASNDWGWNQDFVAPNGDVHNFGWAEACTYAYWMPKEYFIAWLFNQGLGQVRSPVFPFSGVYIQLFRHGYMISTEFGGIPVAYPLTNSCSP